LKEEVKTFLGEELSDEDKGLIGHYFGELQYYVVRDMILNDRESVWMEGVQKMCASWKWRSAHYQLRTGQHYSQGVKRNHLQQ